VTADEIAASAAHVRQLGVATEADEGPIQRADEPRYAIVLTGARRAAPVIRGVEQPDARDIERRRDLRDLRQVRRARTRKRAARQPIEHRHQRQHRGREKAETGVAQRAGPHRAVPGVPRRTAFADIDDRNGRQQRVHRRSKGSGLRHSFNVAA
jgi:hypothetical protein